MSDRLTTQHYGARLTPREGDGRHALDSSLTVEYMPIMDLATTATVSWEALARWCTSDGVIGPSVAFAAGVDPDRASLSVLQLVTRDTCQRFPVSVNMEVALFCGATTLSLAIEACSHAGLHPSLLTVELLEGQPMVTPATADASRVWRSHGFGIAIDDYGAGYATDAAVAAIRPSMVKIDMDVVRRRDSGTVRSAVTKARAVGAVVVAEGIETQSDEHWVRSLGVGLGQGWFYCA